MREIIIFVIGVAVGGLTMWLGMKSRLAWKEARGLMKAPNKAKADGAKQRDKARESAAKGRRQMFWSILFFILLLFIVGALIAALFASV